MKNLYNSYFNIITDFIQIKNAKLVTDIKGLNYPWVSQHPNCVIATSNIDIILFNLMMFPQVMILLHAFKAIEELDQQLNDIGNMERRKLHDKMKSISGGSSYTDVYCGLRIVYR